MRVTFVSVSWSCDPADPMVCVVLDTFLCLILGEETKAVVVDEEAGCAALTCIRLHCYFDGCEGGCAGMD